MARIKRLLHYAYTHDIPRAACVHESLYGPKRRRAEEKRFEATLPVLPRIRGDQDPSDEQAKAQRARYRVLDDHIEAYELQQDERKAYEHRYIIHAPPHIYMM